VLTGLWVKEEAFPLKKRFYMSSGPKRKSGNAKAPHGVRRKRLLSLLAVAVIIAAAGWVLGKTRYSTAAFQDLHSRVAGFVDLLNRRNTAGGRGDYLKRAAFAFNGLEKAVLSPHGAKPVIPAESPPEITVIIDDVGYETRITKKLINLDSNITFSVLPHAPYTEKARKWLREAGREIMLHLPMEGSGRSRRYLGKGALKLNMSPFLIKRIVDDDLAAVPEASGVNNHMGSKFTAWKPGMEAVFDRLARRGLYFVDSVTGSHTVAYDTARKMGLRCAKRDIFLDHNNSAASIKRQWERLLKKARRKGNALAIGHPRPNTYRVLKREIPRLADKGVTLAPASYLVRAVKEGA